MKGDGGLRRPGARVLPALIAVLHACAPSSAPSAGSAAPLTAADTMLLFAADTTIHPGDGRDAYAQAFLDLLDTALANDELRLLRYERRADGLVVVADTTAAPTDFGVVVDADGRVRAAVLGEATASPWGTFVTYAFDANGATIGVEKTWHDPENGCAELVHVTLRWIIEARKVIYYHRRLFDQDDYSMSTYDCLVGAGDTLTAFTSWPALARSVGWSGP